MLLLFPRFIQDEENVSSALAKNSNIGSCVVSCCYAALCGHFPSSTWLLQKKEPFNFYLFLAFFPLSDLLFVFTSMDLDYIMGRLIWILHIKLSNSLLASHPSYC